MHSCVCSKHGGRKSESISPNSSRLGPCSTRAKQINMYHQYDALFGITSTVEPLKPIPTPHSIWDETTYDTAAGQALLYAEMHTSISNNCNNQLVETAGPWNALMTSPRDNALVWSLMCLYVFICVWCHYFGLSLASSCLTLPILRPMLFLRGMPFDHHAPSCIRSWSHELLSLQNTIFHNRSGPLSEAIFGPQIWSATFWASKSTELLASPFNVKLMKLHKYL